MSSQSTESDQPSLSKEELVAIFAEFSSFMRLKILEEINDALEHVAKDTAQESVHSDIQDSHVRLLMMYECCTQAQKEWESLA